MTQHTQHRIVRALPRLLVPLAMVGLALAIWAGLLRIGWSLPTPAGALAAMHGPLMIAGFFGVVISLERAVALRWAWSFAAPLASAFGGFSLVAAPDGPGALLITLGSCVLVGVFAVLLRQHATLYTMVMALGALTWLAGNLLWLAGQPFSVVTLWWAMFLTLTIAGERLELGRLRSLPPAVERLFFGTVAVALIGLVAASLSYHQGTRLLGAGLLALALWLLRYDIARRTVRKLGVTRFIAVCMLSGYGWLVISGALALGYGGWPAGPIYDAQLHALFVGFVFAMIFGHAPIIIPALTGLAVPFTRIFYGHLALLHLSLALRVAGDLLGQGALRRAGGMTNAAAIVLFLLITGVSILRGRQAPTSRPALQLTRNNQ